MSAYGIHATFVDRAGYQRWLEVWKRLYGKITQSIRAKKRRLRELNSSPVVLPNFSGQKLKSFLREYEKHSPERLQSRLAHERVMAHKLMTARTDAKLRMARIRQMKADLEKQNAHFPLMVTHVSNADVFFNKASLTFPCLPAWVLRFRGETYYLPHIRFDHIVGESKENPDHPSTKGLLRFKKCNISIEANGVATIAKE